ncbi:MAG: AMP-binding protein, partial [Gemmatimonas sp.]|nr:AMP-binding protein [Gemmatimonas sp.]
NIYPAVFSGCKLVFEARRFDPAASEERMARYGTTVYNGVPAFFAMMCDLPERRPGAAPELMIMSGSALTEGLHRRMHERWPTTTVANWYGLNESGSGQTLNHGADMDRHPSSIGRPLPPTEIRVVDADLNRRALPRRLAVHRRPRRRGQGRATAPRGSERGPDQPRRLQVLPGGDRLRARQARRGVGGGGARRATRRARPRSD